MAELINRVSAKPNRRKITPENGEAFYATVEYADEPVVNGNTVNKQNVLDTVYPLSDNSAVGTVVCTVVSPDERWLLCNGAEVAPTVYPELSKLLPAIPVQASSVKKINLRNAPNFYLRNIKYCNGYYIGTGNDVSSGSGLIVYTDNPAGDWRAAELASGHGSSSYSSIIWDITYAAGYYVAVGSVYAKSSNGYDMPYVFYSTSLASGWQKVSLGGITRVSGMSICYATGKFVASCNRTLSTSGTSNAAVYHAARPTDNWEMQRTGDYTITLPGVWYSTERRRFETVYIYTTMDSHTYAKVQMMYCTDIATGSWQTLGSSCTLSIGDAVNYYPDILSYYIRDGHYLCVLVGKSFTGYIPTAEYPWGVLLRCDLRTGVWAQEADTGKSNVPYMAYADNAGDQMVMCSSNDMYNIGNGWKSRQAGIISVQGKRVSPMLAPVNGYCILPSSIKGELLSLPGMTTRYLPLLPCQDSNGIAKNYVKAR